MKKKCEICGKAYEYCPNCPRDMYKPTWMHRFDDERCKNLWDILSANGIGNITADEALAKLNEIDYKSITIVNPALRNHIKDIESQVADKINAEAIEAEFEDMAMAVTEEIVAAEDVNTAFDETEEVKTVPTKKRKGFRH